MEGKQLKLKYKEDFKKMVRKEKAMHGKFPNYLHKDHVGVELSFEQMKHTGLKEETEGLITAAQDQALNNRYYSKHIIKKEPLTDAECAIPSQKLWNMSYQGAKH